jgi:hypothetical protein
MRRIGVLASKNGGRRLAIPLRRAAPRLPFPRHERHERGARFGRFKPARELLRLGIGAREDLLARAADEVARGSGVSG